MPVPMEMGEMEAMVVQRESPATAAMEPQAMLQRLMAGTAASAAIPERLAMVVQLESGPEPRPTARLEPMDSTQPAVATAATAATASTSRPARPALVVPVVPAAWSVTVATAVTPVL